MIKLLVSIVNYNSYDDSLCVIKSILNDIDTSGFEIHFFIVDNGDKSDQNKFLSKVKNLIEFELVSFDAISNIPLNYLINSENNGFGAANNIMIEHLRKSQYYDLVWMLNSDLELDFNCLSSLKKYILDNKYNILGSVIVEENFTIYGTDNMDSFKGYGSLSKDKIVQDIFEVDAVSGTSMFFKSQVLKNVKFDEKFFMYVEENDLCYELKKQGIKSYVVKDSIVYHHSGKTFGKNQALRWYYKVRNLLYFKRKNSSNNFILIPYLFISTLKNFKLNKYYLKAYFFGVLDYLNKQFGKTMRSFS
jgi:GT2 family glycosyltransferase